MTAAMNARLHGSAVLRAELQAMVDQIKARNTARQCVVVAHAQAPVAHPFPTGPGATTDGYGNDSPSCVCCGGTPGSRTNRGFTGQCCCGLAS